jgi:hypothetical protein
MKFMVLKVYSSLTKPRTWKVAISTILMNYESLWLRIENPKLYTIFGKWIEITFFS